MIDKLAYHMRDSGPEVFEYISKSPPILIWAFSIVVIIFTVCTKIGDDLEE